jgi:undecaprenyl-phosphate galactose phosphotransferase
MQNRFIKRYSKKKLFLFTGDIIFLFFGSMCALCVRYNFGRYDIVSPFINFPKFIQYSLVVFITLISFRYFNLYKQRNYLSITGQLLQIIKAITLSAVIIIISDFFIKSKLLETDSRLQLFLFYVVNVFLIAIYRIIVLGLYKYSFRGSSIFKRRAIAIGAGEVGKKFVNLIRSGEALFIDLIGFVDDDPEKVATYVNDIMVLGETTYLKEIVEEYFIDEIFITIESISHDKLFSLINLAQGTHCQVNLISSHFNVINRKVDTTEYNNLQSVPIFTQISPFYTDYLKRIIDIIIGTLMLIFIFPVILLIVILIKLTTKGPAFYKAKVIGKDGEPFTWYKFRSMKASDSTLHEEHLKDIILGNKTVEKIKNDPRITPVGKYIRKYSLDELPQLINVIKGEMSLVGPRPSLIYEYELMDKWQRKRFNVTPGITGLWQIFGRNRSDVNFNDSIILDLYYSNNISFWFDLKILLKTIPVVIFGRGGS